MRRSKAPSMASKTKRFCNNLHKDSQGSDPEDETYNWGSKDNPAAQNENVGENKRIFNVVWRDKTTKKHKTWKGDGTLEVNILSMKAILKDDTGKYMGCASKFQISELQADYQMIVGGKEIEVQNEMDEEEIYQLRKKQMENRNWGSEEWVSPEKRAEEDKKPKGGFHFKPVLVLKPPEVPQTLDVKSTLRGNDHVYKWGTMTKPAVENHKLKIEQVRNIPEESKWANQNIPEISKVGNNEKFSTETNSEDRAMSITPHKHQDFMCFIKPSELQQYVFQQVSEYYTKHQLLLNVEELKSLDIKHILELTCNHPSFIKQTESTNKLVQFLSLSLPDWSEMGPFDSGKLEFVQYFLQPSGGKVKDNTIIIAKNINALNMLQGLCDFMNIQCLRLIAEENESTKEQIIKEYLKTSAECTTKVLLTSSIQALKDFGFLLKKQQLIVFENIAANMNEFKDMANLNLANMYYLITAFSIEEFLILSNLQNASASIKDILDMIKTGFDHTFCFVHSKIECKCGGNGKNNTSNKDLQFFKNWRHRAAPFDEEFLKDSGLENSSENLVTVFSNTR